MAICYYNANLSRENKGLVLISQCRTWLAVRISQLESTYDRCWYHWLLFGHLPVYSTTADKQAKRFDPALHTWQQIIQKLNRLRSAWDLGISNKSSLHICNFYLCTCFCISAMIGVELIATACLSPWHKAAPKNSSSNISQSIARLKNMVKYYLCSVTPLTNTGTRHASNHDYFRYQAHFRLPFKWDI